MIDRLLSMYRQLLVSVMVGILVIEIGNMIRIINILIIPISNYRLMRMLDDDCDNESYGDSISEYKLECLGVK